jgi:RNA polymerase sigma-70 factor, ECF subfamily
VYRYAYAVLGNHADAEDVTQQTFLNAYRAVSEGTKPRKTEHWLLTIAHNEVRRHFRRAQSKPVEVELDEEVVDNRGERSEPSLADVVRALQHLPPIQRSALVMREFEGRSYKEIAGILDVTQSALEALVFRARRALAEQLEDALTCHEAEQAVSRRLDARLPRREARRLKSHLRECPVCVRFATVQKRQRSLLKGFSIMPIPASLFLFRGEHAAAGLGGGAAAAGSTAGVGIGTAIAAKSAAVTATIAVAGGVGYTVAKPEPPPPTPRVAHAVPTADPRANRPIAAGTRQRSSPERPGQARRDRSKAAVIRRKPEKHATGNPHSSPARAKAAKHVAKKQGQTPAVPKAAGGATAAKKPKHAAPKTRTRPIVAQKSNRPEARQQKPRAPRAVEKAKSPRDAPAGPPPPEPPPRGGPKS